MFRDVDADFYLMVDGDGTYDASVAPRMIALAMAGPFDVVNCIRKETEGAAYRRGHRWGNSVLTGTVQLMFGDRVQDMLSGYKVLSRRFVKSFPALSQGFDIETELSVHALELSLPIAHETGIYRPRADGSESKLRTVRDGWRIFTMILKLLRHERPVFFFGLIGGVLSLTSVLIATPVVLTYLETGLVPRLPTAVLSAAIMLLAALCWFTGVILDTVSRGRREVRLLTYLMQPPYQAR